MTSGSIKSEGEVDSSSLNSVLTAPELGATFADQPSASELADAALLPSTSHASHYGGTSEARRTRRPKKRRRRAKSLTDLRKMRPIIASPFMPLATQVSVEAAAAEREREMRSRRPAALSTTTPRLRASTAREVPGSNVNRAKYGSVPIKSSVPSQEEPIIAKAAEKDDEEEEEEDEEDEESSEESSSEDESTYTRFSDLTKKQWATVAMLAIANLCSTVAFSCIAPFYPGEASLKGMTTTETGIVFGAFELVMFITAPLLGKYMVFFGSKRMFSVGLLITGITAIAFGFLNLLPAGRIFFWSSLIIRCAEALGDACFVTSSFAISAKCFPGRIATIVGIMETFAGLGYTAGPVIGGVLYEYGGFQLPFFVLGALLVLATFLSCFLVEEIEDEPSEDAKGMFEMLRIPVIWLMVFAVVICAISLSFFDPTLSSHLASFKLSATMVGLMFLLCGGIYTLTAPLWGLLIDRWHCTNSLMLFGSLATIVSMLLVGPSPLLNVEKNLILIGFALAILGVAAGALYIPTFQNCLDAVKENGYDDSFQTYGCVSGVFQSAFAFGAFIGPTLGGLSVESIGFGWTTTWIAGINCVFVITLLISYIVKRWQKHSSQQRKSRSPLPVV